MFTELHWLGGKLIEWESETLQWFDVNEAVSECTVRIDGITVWAWMIYLHRTRKRLRDALMVHMLG